MEGTDAQGLLLHSLAWQAYAGLYMGNWNEVVEDVFPRAAALLEDRSEPPYFAQNLFGTIAVIGCDPQGRHRCCSGGLPVLDRLVDGRGGTGANSGMAAAAWRAWVAIRQGDLATADASIELSQSIPARGHWPLLLVGPSPARCLSPTDVRSSNRSSRRCVRGLGTRGSCRSSPRSTVSRAGSGWTKGTSPRAIPLLEGAVRRFDELGGRWDAACTRLDLAQAYREIGDPEGANRELDAAIPLFRTVRAPDELGTAERLRASIGSN